ncbi:hypothetical protein ACFQI7_28090 [Paenibacillus allorhizosphaerae]|uniref:Uncharacterized protein n=1 Tax=Paenibacillus allorhizosphaerae TaxID=2849866 RepID=A0ABM8VNN6_9BACL|nr:hypothetical protein [Paenibacillus allorhizosphaerae]CAG7651552.1 hypothetical protein PAECIP111802_04992 [Paenibacillus allorhizosphaerae]
MPDFYSNAYLKGKKLQTDADFQNAIWFNLWVDIYRHGELVEYGGFIERSNEHAVWINGGYFLRNKWQIIVR